MQVSWIDPDEVRELLKQLEGPIQPPAASAWEVHTLPVTPVASAPEEPLMGETASQQAPAETLADDRPGPGSAELWRIRERLRALREKAHVAGIFSRPRQDERPAPSETGKEAAAPEAVSAAAPPPAMEVPPSPPTVESPFNLAEAPAQVPAPAPAAELEPEPAPVEPLFEAAASSPAPAQAAVEVAPEPAVPAGREKPFIVPNQGLSERLNAVAEWVCARQGTREVLLVDDYGDVLWGAHQQTPLVLSAMMAWHSSQRASATATCIDPERIDKPLAAHRALTVLPLRTRYGAVSLALIQDQPVTDEDAAAIRHALFLAVEGPDTTATPSVNDAA